MIRLIATALAGALVGALAALPGSALGQGVVQVPEVVSVDRAEITLGDIARIDGFAPEIRLALASQHIGQAADPGQHRTVSAGLLRLRVAGVAPGAVIDVPNEVRIETAKRAIAPDFVRARLEAAIRHSMPWRAESVKLDGWRLPAAFAAPARATRFRIRFPENEDFVGHLDAEFEVLDPDQSDRVAVRRTAGVDIFVTLELPIAARDLRRGETLGPDALRIEKRTLRSLPQGIVRNSEQVIGLRLLQRVRAGAPLRAMQLEIPRVVRRGDAIVVLAGSPGLELQVEARALENGAPGQVIRVENRTTRRAFLAEVLGAGRARAALPGVAGGLSRGAGR